MKADTYKTVTIYILIADEFTFTAQAFGTYAEAEKAMIEAMGCPLSQAENDNGVYSVNGYYYGIEEQTITIPDN